jgi:RHS repeat-associated protein
LAESDDAGNTLTEYVWFDDMPIALVANVDTSPSLYFVHTDHLDRPIMMTDANKSIVWQADYNPFGGVYSITGSATNNLRFPGQYFLMEDGLHYNWYRNYDPTIARYIQPDPLGFVNGPSIYAYAGGNPFARIDPLGLTWADNWNMFWSWGSGNASPNTTYGPASDQSIDMMQSPGVANAVNYFAQKNAGQCPNQWSPVTNYDYNFGLKGLWQAGANSTQQFVGSYSVNVYPNAHGTLDVHVYNTTSMTSFFYGIYPNALNPPNGWPMGNASQEYVGVVPAPATSPGCSCGNQ